MSLAFRLRGTLAGWDKEKMAGWEKKEPAGFYYLRASWLILTG